MRSLLSSVRTFFFFFTHTDLSEGMRVEGGWNSEAAGTDKKPKCFYVHRALQVI